MTNSTLLNMIDGGTEIHKSAVPTACLFHGQGKLGLVIQPNSLLKTFQMFMCAMTFHRSKGKSRNMKCNISPSWLSWSTWLRKILCRAGVPQNTLTEQAVIITDISVIAVYDFRNRHNPEKGRELIDYTEFP